MKYVPIKRISLKHDARVNERWVQDVLAADPTLLGLGELVLVEKERIQPSGGRLDMLFREVDGNTRYETELQLGPTDETHIIRTIEYWDIERRRYPQYEHVGIIIAESVTSRFLNVISLFNGFIPLIAMQVAAIEIDGGIALHFTKVVDALQLGSADEDEDVVQPADRAYWETRASPATVKIADEVLNLCREFDPSLSLNFNKQYIGFGRGGIPFNFATCGPRKSAMNLTIRLEADESISERMEQSGIDLQVLTRGGRFRLRLRAGDVSKHRNLLHELLHEAYEAHK